MKITSVEKNKKSRNKLPVYSVYIDGKFSFPISEDDYISMNLYENSELTEDKVDYIKNTLNFRRAKSAAVKYLSARLRTENEVRTKLRNEGYDAACEDRVVEELKAIGYINNKLYAQKYVYDRSKLKPLSKRLMKYELLNRGIPEEIADEVLSDWKVEDINVAGSLLKRKFGKYDLSDDKTARKAYMFLMHRGFSNETIREAINSVNGETYLKD